jgi:hypothetical protein
MINIITRTHNRPDYFRVCRDSVESQIYKNYNWIVGSDSNCEYYPEAIRLFTDTRQPLYVPQGHYYAPWNLHLNRLLLEVKNGWVMFLDDDDKFVNEKSLKRIAAACTDENRLVVWKVQITPEWIVPASSFGHYIKAGDFSGIGMCFHTKHLPVDWGNISYGDYRVAWQLQQKGLKVKWIDMVLTSTQKGAHNGRS